MIFSHSAAVRSEAHIGRFLPRLPRGFGSGAFGREAQSVLGQSSPQNVSQGLEALNFVSRGRQAALAHRARQGASYGGFGSTCSHANEHGVELSPCLKNVLQDLQR